MESFINGIKSQYEESLKVVLGRTDVDLMDKDPETGCRAVRKARPTWATSAPTPAAI